MNPSANQSIDVHPITRRRLLKITTVAAAGLGLGGYGTALLTRLAHEGRPPFLTFTLQEAATLIALCERIIPRDDTPGATDLGVIHYIDRNLQGALSEHRDTYHRGIVQLDRWSVSEHSLGFAELTADVQDALLKRLESNDVDPAMWRDSEAPAFFRLVIDHTMQGFYGPPRHGGNKDYASYRILGLDYPQIIGQNRYRES